MALEAVVFPQDPLFGYYSTNKDFFNLLSSSAATSFSFSHDDHNAQDDHDQDQDDQHYFYFPQNSPLLLDHDYWNNSSSSISNLNFNELLLEQPRPDPSPLEEVVAETMDGGGGGGGGGERSGRAARRRRTRRGKGEKNKEEMESQRMTHITVERNRRKQMNEYLSVLRSLMPHSYVQRSDQASIIGGAINFVKELEQQVHLLSAQTDVKPFEPNNNNNNNNNISSPFSHFFTFPQYFLSSSPSPSPSPSPSSFSLNSFIAVAAMASSNDHNNLNNPIQSSIADVEVSMAESHANLKIRCKKLPKQLLKIVSGLHSLRLTVLHLNVSTAHQMALYSFSLKVEEDCGLSSVDEIARGVYQLICRIQEEAFSI